VVVLAKDHGELFVVVNTSRMVLFEEALLGAGEHRGFGLATVCARGVGTKSALTSCGASIVCHRVRFRAF
jgi:hypothetical protein